MKQLIAGSYSLSRACPLASGLDTWISHEQVKEYTHRKRAERHLKGNIKGRVAKLRAQGMDLPVMDGVVPKGPPSGRPVMTLGKNNFARYNKDMDVLTANGFIRARMVRVRLLHYLVCRLVGAFHDTFFLVFAATTTHVIWPPHGCTTVTHPSDCRV